MIETDRSERKESTISGLCAVREAEHVAFRERSLRFHRYTYWFVDDVHVSVRLGRGRPAVPAGRIGVRDDGLKD